MAPRRYTLNLELVNTALFRKRGPCNKGSAAVLMLGSGWALNPMIAVLKEKGGGRFETKREEARGRRGQRPK